MFAANGSKHNFKIKKKTEECVKTKITYHSVI